VIEYPLKKKRKIYKTILPCYVTMLGDLTTFIEKQRKKGFNDDEIKATLVMYGWSLSLVNEGFSVILKKEDSRKVMISVISVLLLLSAGFILVSNASITSMSTYAPQVSCIEIDGNNQGYLGLVTNSEACCRVIKQSNNCLFEEETIKLTKHESQFFSYDYVCFQDSNAVLIPSRIFEYCYN